MGLGDFLHGAGDALNAVSGGTVRRAIFGGEDPLSPANFGEDVEAVKGVGKSVYESGKLSIDLMNTPRKVLTEAILHPTEIPEHLGSAVRTGQEIFNHRRQVADLGLTVGEHVLREQLDPKNIALNVALIAATGGGSAMVEAGAAGMEGVRAFKAGATATEAYQTARGALTASSTARTAFEGATAADELAAATKTGLASGPTRAARGPLGQLQEGYGNWRTALKGDIRESLGMQRTGMLGAQRQRLAGAVGERIGTEGFAREAIGRTIAGTPGAPTSGGFMAESLYRGRASLSAVSDVQTAKTVAQQYTPLLKIANDPKGALTQMGMQAAKTHKGEIVKFGAEHAGQAVKYLAKKAFSGDKDEEEVQPRTAAPPPTTTQGIGLMQFSADQTHATAVSRRRPGAPAQLGTVVQNTTMPSQVGPSDWYGPQGGYDAGRGFQQRSGPLPALEQPRAMAGI